MTLWVLPIEPLEERYSAQWLRWWQRYAEQAPDDIRFVLGSSGQAGQQIRTGEWLDVYQTNAWKATQLEEFVRYLEAGAVSPGDVVLLHDGWSFQATALAYMRDLGKIPFRIMSCLHAGTWDPHDFVSKSPVRYWGRMVERGWLHAYDRVFVATYFHRDLILATHPGVEIVVTGFPLFAQEVRPHYTPWAEREPLIVFPHRLADEKRPYMFEDLRVIFEAQYPGVPARWVRTKDECSGKMDYYRMLGQAKVAVSFAKQETWGIAMLEAGANGVHVVVPDELAYVDVWPLQCRYSPDDLFEAADLVREGLEDPSPAEYDFERWECAIARIVKEALR